MLFEIHFSVLHIRNYADKGWISAFPDIEMYLKAMYHLDLRSLYNIER